MRDRATGTAKEAGVTSVPPMPVLAIPDAQLHIRLNDWLALRQCLPNGGEMS
jgi:hypothetical protein